jgi:predicted ribosome quality control (RQC) complex YloA/Tae2 family protein
MQPVDFTTLMAVCAAIRSQWLPARFEQAYQRDRFTVLLALRTFKQRGWLTLSWHPQAARMHMSDPPPRDPDTFTFSQQLRHQLGGLALVAIEPVSTWERAIDLQFAQRPGEPALWHLYIEIMGQYSNAILVNQDHLIVTAAHQVSSNQSSVRPIQTGQPYELPPARLDPAPSLSEDFERWQSRIALVPGAMRKNLVKSYRGLSSALALSMLGAAEIEPDRSTDELSETEWRRLFESWQFWLKSLQSEAFQPGFTASGYTVLWGEGETSVQKMIDRYYQGQLNQQVFTQLRHQITQRLNNALGKLRVKAEEFESRLDRSDRADQAKRSADLLMAHLH